ncbi:HAD family hydrolase [Halobaculum sp. CBA1158]|uniref:HAD family hydrolase n=1 Tax=Halobaculum sp. CBA1158 TaxID=2904243 RepID=UPI001F47E07C|nr:HAD family hydrolase [Halobaculum sp. CBA1158]UIP00609.1 HAD family hydrolase [Halobaculum sp. CBA1158]
MTVDAVLFDLDDTLYPYDPCNEAGKRAAFEAYRDRGGTLDADGFEASRARARRATKREIPATAASHSRHIYYTRLVDDLPGPFDAGLARALGDAYWNAYLDEMVAFENALETLAALREANVAVAVVTNLTTRVQLRKLARLGVDEHLDAFVTSEEVGREKPAAPVFTTALARLDRTPSEALVVGNSPANDIEGGNALGMETALFNGPDADIGGGDDDLGELRTPDHRIDSLSGVTEVAL